MYLYAPYVEEKQKQESTYFTSCDFTSDSHVSKKSKQEMKRNNNPIIILYKNDNNNNNGKQNRNSRIINFKLSRMSFYYLRFIT